jgi:8-oxo-dGTP pyrophosphatase MutT (NUDIX family)
MVAPKASFRPRRIPGRRLLNRAAVAVVIAKHPEPAVLMLQRCRRIGDPWSGDMAFPGGRWEPGDSSIAATALRELREETGIALSHWDTPLRLSDVVTRSHNHYYPMVITPFLFVLETRPTVHVNRESQQSFWISLTHFQPHNASHFEWPIITRPFRVGITLPCYFYEQQRVWGLSLKILQDLTENALSFHDQATGAFSK